MLDHSVAVFVLVVVKIFPNKVDSCNANQPQHAFFLFVFNSPGFHLPAKFGPQTKEEGLQEEVWISGD